MMPTSNPRTQSVALVSLSAAALLICAWSSWGSSSPQLRSAPLNRARPVGLRNFPQFHSPTLSSFRRPSRNQLRRACICNAIGLYYSTQTGNTETVAGKIAEMCGEPAQEIGDVSAADLSQHDGLIVGAPTWHTDADTERSGTAWDDVLDEIRGLSLSGKPVAVFGVGDSVSYSENFCDAIEELHDAFVSAGAKMVGYVDPSGYQHESSKSIRDGKFLGLPLDEDNEYDMTDARLNTWMQELKAQGMPI